MTQTKPTLFSEKITGKKPRRSAAVAALLFSLQIATASFAEAPQAAPAPSLPSRAALAPVASLQGVTYEDKVLRIRLDRPVSYRVFSLEKPERLVVELSHTLHGEKPYEAPLKDEFLKKIRFAQFQSAPDKIARVVLEVSKQVPFEAVQDGNDILIKFGAKNEVSASAPAPKAKPAALEEAAVTGQMEETVESAASSTSGGNGRSSHGKDLLASLPKNPVTIDFDDAEISDVLRVLSEMSGINVIHAANVRGTVSVHLDQVPFNEAFATILTMQGLVAQQMGSNVLRILTPEDLNSDRSRAVVTYKTFVLNYASAAEVQPLMGTVKISPNSKTEINERNNSLIVTDTPEGLAAAERLISELDTRPQQVLIEAKIVEVSLSNSMDLGIRWEYANANTSGGRTQILGQRDTVAGAANVTPGTVGFVTGAGATAALAPVNRGTGVSLPNTSPASSAITFGFINKTDVLTATLNALATEGKTKVLSAPRIITINNKNAKIQVGSKIPFSTVVVSAGGTTTQSITFQDVGIILDVTPVINADNRIRLTLKPQVSVPGITTAAGPQINTRQAETEVIIRDGETLVVGGLIDEQTRQNVSKVPLLGDIPVLGAFFRSSFDQKNRTELLIFVTPRIIRD